MGDDAGGGDGGPRAQDELPDRAHRGARQAVGAAPLRVELTADERRSAWVVALEGAVLRRAGWRLGPLDVSVGHGERLLISGANGSGKSTLIGALAGRVALAAGRRR